MAALTAEALETLSVQQLEQTLAKSKLQAEQKLLEENGANVGAITSVHVTSKTVGPVLYLEVEVECQGHCRLWSPVDGHLPCFAAPGRLMQERARSSLTFFGVTMHGTVW